MIRYHTEKLDNELKQEAVKAWRRAGLLDEATAGSIGATIQTTYRKHHFMARIGLFVFAFILVHACIGLFAFLFFEDAGEDAWPFLFLLSGVLLIWILDLFISKKNYHHNGIDTLLLYSGLMYVGVAIAGFSDARITDADGQVLFVMVMLLPVIFILVLLFSEEGLAALLVILGTASIAQLTYNMFGYAAYAVLITTPGNFFLLKQLIRGQSRFPNRHYSACFTWAGIAAYTMLYAPFNMFVMYEWLLNGREISETTNNLITAISISGMVLIPAGYILYGLLKKSKDIMMTGLVLIPVSVATIRYYYSLMPLEVALMLGGLLLILVAYAGIQWLRKHQESDYTFEAEADEEMSQAEWLLITQQYMNKTITEDKGLMSGGGFGGGGADDKF